ncbi:arsenate reductase/protein-tyrosine-phosphatase family protein [Leifsonia poae]|uniref:arsenate reductase/protein-tyrosine-phosphatase family protein n=1 Tax=Leifsonia poae TaxID=110933 RepID=UPI001CBEBA2B|nr:hypothetical protein [Leifsonia poae]
MPDSLFRILTVCTGNICRSPAADLLFAADLAGDERFAVSSAGTHAESGWPISPPMGALLAEQGIPSDGFVARQATKALLAESDLVLTATREHREWITGHDPRTVRRAFTMTEFADAVRAHPNPAELTAAELVAWAAANRPSAGVTTRGATTRRGYVEGDILDPYGRGDAAYVASLAQIQPLTRAISAVLLTTH